MWFLRIAAVLAAVVAAPLLTISAENLAERAREAHRNAEARGPMGHPGDRVRVAAARSQDDSGGSFGASAGRSRAAEAGAAGGAPVAPTFARIVIEAGGAASVEGFGTPGVEVALSLDADVVGRTKPDRSGAWRLVLDRPIRPGDHRISISATSPDRSRVVLGQEVRVAIPDAFAGKAVVAYEAPAGEARGAVASPVRRQAEELAAAASERFSEVVGNAKAPPASSSQRLAEAPQKGAGGTPPAPAKSGSEKDGGGAVLAPVLQWVRRSAETYQTTIIKGLSPLPQPGGSRAAGASTAAPRPSATARPATPSSTWEIPVVGGTLLDAQLAAQEWLARANRTYQTEIMRKLEAPAASAVATAAGDKGAKPAPPVKAVGGEATSGEADRAKAAQKAAEDERRRSEAAAEEARRVEAAKRVEEAKRAEDAKRTQQVAKEPAKEVAKEAAKPAAPAPADQAKAEAARKAADSEAQRKRVAEEAQKKGAEARRQADEIARKKTEEEARKSASAEAARRESEAKRVAAEKAAQRTADEARKASEKAAEKAAERQRAAETRKAQDAAAAAKRAETAAKAAAAQAEKLKTAKAAERPKDTRIAEGSGEKGPVDRPAPPRREEIDRSTRSGLGAGTAPAAAGAAAGAATGGAASGATSAKETAANGSQRSRACRRAGQRVSMPGIYVVRDGDTLSEIVELHYGDVGRLRRVLRANRGRIGDPDMIRPCQRIRLP